MLEVLVTTVILVVAIGGLLSSMTSSVQLQTSAEETATAFEALRAKTEEMESATFSEIFALYNGNPGDDPGGANTAPGSDFAVPGLPPRPDDADGMVGEIVFPSPAQPSVVLRENVVDPDLGMPRDLDLDGSITNVSRNADYALLPVTLRLRWRGVAGNRELEVHLLLVE